MNLCNQIEDKVTDYILGFLNEFDTSQIKNHIASCEKCKMMYQESENLHKNVLSLGKETVPSKVREEVLTRIHTDLGKETQLVGGMSFGRILAAVGAGMGGVLIYLLILWGRVDMNALSSAQLLTVVGIWVGLMISTFCWLLGRYRLGNLDLSFPALFGILTSGIAGVGIIFCPNETYFALWERSDLSHATINVLGVGGSYALFGLIYALPLALLVSTAVRSRLKDNFMGSGLVGAGVAVLLWLPAAYLQCSALAFGFLLAWAGGVLIGVVGGFWGGIGLRGLVPATR